MVREAADRRAIGTAAAMNPFRELLLPVLAAATVAGAVPADVSDEQVAAFRHGVEKGCADRSVASGNDLFASAGYCHCVLKVLDRELGADEWKMAALHDLRKERDKSMAVLAPYLHYAETCRKAD